MLPFSLLAGEGFLQTTHSQSLPERVILGNCFRYVIKEVNISWKNSNVCRETSGKPWNCSPSFGSTLGNILSTLSLAKRCRQCSMYRLGSTIKFISETTIRCSFNKWSANNWICSGRSKNWRQLKHIVGPPHFGEYPTWGTVPDRVLKRKVEYKERRLPYSSTWKSEAHLLRLFRAKLLVGIGKRFVQIIGN